MKPRRACLRSDVFLKFADLFAFNRFLQRPLNVEVKVDLLKVRRCMMGNHNEDFAEGYRTKGWSNQPGAQSFNEGGRAALRDQQLEFSRSQAAVREQQRLAEQRAINSSSSLPYSAFPTSGSSQSPTWTTGSSGSGAGFGSMEEAAKVGAGGFFILFCLYAFIQPASWSWLQLGMGTACAVIAGGIAGVALYIALKVLAFMLKVALGLLGIGIILHLLGVLDIFAVLAPLLRML